MVPAAAHNNDGMEADNRSAEATTPNNSNVLTSAKGTPSQPPKGENKCSIKGCKLGRLSVPMDTCAASTLNGAKECNREVHIACYEGIVVKNSKGEIKPAHPDGEMAGKAFCTRACYRNYMKANQGGSNWHDDGKEGRKDKHCSENILVTKYLSNEEEYRQFRRPPDGMTKEKICQRWADGINSCGVQHKRGWKDVMNKIQTIESQMRAALDFSETETGQGLQNGEFENWEAAIKSKCKFWFQLHEVFIQRAGMKPSATTSDHKRRIRWYNTGYPGSAHDNRMWRRSPLKTQKEKYFTVFEYIITDTAFDPGENVLPAYKAMPGQTFPEDEDEKLFNTVISPPRVSSEHVNGIWKGRFPWLRLIPNLIKGRRSLKEVLKYIHCTVILHNLLIDLGDKHIDSWERDNDELSDIAAPDRVPTGDMPREERMLYSDVPENAPKDWRRDIVKEYLRERHAVFLQERSTRVDDDSDEEMEDLDAIQQRFEAYMDRLRNKL
jgi:hypothetical protein